MLLLDESNIGKWFDVHEEGITVVDGRLCLVQSVAADQYLGVRSENRATGFEYSTMMQTW